MDEALRTAPSWALAHAMDHRVRRREPAQFPREERELARPGEGVDERLRIVQEMEVIKDPLPQHGGALVEEGGEEHIVRERVPALPLERNPHDLGHHRVR